jgi:hypothetical protein
MEAADHRRSPSRPAACAGRAEEVRSPVIPCPKSRPFMRLTCRIRSFVRASRSRETRRRSSFSGVGALTIAHTLGSPRIYASRVRSSISPSIRSVLTRRARRGAHARCTSAMAAGAVVAHWAAARSLTGGLRGLSSATRDRQLTAEISAVPEGANAHVAQLAV